MRSFIQVMYCLGEGFVQTSVCEAEDKINEGEVVYTLACHMA